MALSLATVGAKITATAWNLIVTAVNATWAVSVVPTSVSGAGVTVDSTGKVSFTAATSVVVNGCFTSAYNNYLIEMDITTTGAASLPLVLRAAGVNSTSAYDRTRLSGVGATASAAQSLNAAAWEMVAAVITGRHVVSLKVVGPAAAVATVGTIITGSTDNPMTVAAGINNAVIQHRTASSHDGFTITPSTGSITGNLRITGLN
jgi:hypothetical protein